MVASWDIATCNLVDVLRYIPEDYILFILAAIRTLNINENNVFRRRTNVLAFWLFITMYAMPPLAL